MGALLQPRCAARRVRTASALLRAFAIAVATQLLLLPLLIAAGVGTLERNAVAGGPALLPVAQLVGGLVFGAGMALAGGCVTGMLWKAGAGAAALAIAIAGFAIGELLIRNAGSELIATLDDASRPGERALTGLLERRLHAACARARRRGVRRAARPRSRRPDRRLALGVWRPAPGSPRMWPDMATASASSARPTARARAIETGGALPFQLWLALGVIAGGAALGERRLRIPDAARAARAAAGGLLMGAGGTSPTAATSAMA